MNEVCPNTPEAASPKLEAANYMTVRGAAERLRGTTWDVYCAVKGKLAAFQPAGKGSAILIRPNDLERYVLASPAAAWA